MCNKHQYSTWSEYGSTWYYIFQQKKYKCLVITERDLILHWYYITRGAKVKFTIHKRLGGCLRAAGWESCQQVKRRQNWKDLRLVRLLLEESLIFRSVLLGPSSEAWTSKSTVVRKQPHEYVKRSQIVCSINTCVPGSMSCIQIMQIWNNYNEQYNTESEFNECSQIIILLLLLIRHICLCVCPGNPVHIHPYTNKMSFVIENWWGINELYLYWVRAYPGQWPRSIWYWVRADR